MKKIIGLTFVMLLMAGCTSKPVPEWINSGHQQMERYKQAYLTGSSLSVAEIRFRNAVGELKKSGDPDILGKAWLTKMALQAAALDEIEEGEYPKIDAAAAVPANRNFFHFLRGDIAAVDGSLLPERYRSFWAALRSADAGKTASVVAAIEDPLSRLIAAGLAVRHRVENRVILQTAVDTASRNGWKRPLTAWLKRLKSFYEMTGDTDGAAAAGRRLDLL